MQLKKCTELNLEEVKHLYYDLNMTQTEVAEKIGVSQKVVFKFMRRNNLPSRIAAKRHQRGSDNSYWKGGVRTNEQGYIEVYKPDYEHARPNGYVREHIYVVEKALGRRLKFYSVGDPRNEVVHHLNGTKTDNRLENLIVLTAGEHMKLHSASNKEMVDEVLLCRIRQLEQELQEVYSKNETEKQT